LREIQTIDLKDLIPKETSRGDEVIQRIDGNYISVCYERPRAGKAIIGQSRGRKIKKGIIHIKIYSAVVREVFKYWVENLPQLL